MVQGIRFARSAHSTAGSLWRRARILSGASLLVGGYVLQREGSLNRPACERWSLLPAAERSGCRHPRFHDPSSLRA
ncbi:hypothetical protein [Streptomyces sp. NPDC091027]|uniref:hypothetical protein n=1 Tax=Streptomyces sp. NPDC091027 TaxID=3365971 RepID=UPI003828038B